MTEILKFFGKASTGRPSSIELFQGLVKNLVLVPQLVWSRSRVHTFTSSLPARRTGLGSSDDAYELDHLMDPLTHSQLLRLVLALVLAGSIFASLVHGDSKVVVHHAPNRTRPDAVFGLIAHNVRPTQQLQFKKLTQHTTVMSDLDSSLYWKKKSTTSMHPLTDR